MKPQEIDRIECAIRHIESSLDDDPCAVEIAVEAMQKQIPKKPIVEMNDRDCENCAHHTGGSCSVWECSYEPIENEMISRQAVIDALCGECQGNCIPCKSFPCGEIKAVQALPSAQPKLEQSTHSEQGKSDKLGVKSGKTCTDAINRQAAIDALIEEFKRTPTVAIRAKHVIEQLSSAELEIVRCRECKYCEHWYADKGRCFLWHEDGISVFEDGFCNYAERKTDE